MAHFKSGLDKKNYTVVEAFKLSHETIDKFFTEFDKYFEPKNNIIGEQYRFLECHQIEDKYFDKFYIELKKLVRNCEFGD